jgi:predicted dehydrogenase
MATTVGLIGAGKHGQRYLNHVRTDAPSLRLAALSRQNADAGAAQAAELGVAFHADWRALVDDPAVDAVIAVVPPTLHAAIVEAVCRVRKPLLIEKPLATTSAAAAGIVRRVREAGIPALMAHTLRWNGVVRAVAGRLPALGALRALMLNQRFEPSPLAWLDDPARSGGGILLHTGVHSFDLLRNLTGREVRQVWCRTRSTNTTRTEDEFLAMCELADAPTLVAVGGSRATAGRSGLIDVACADAQLVADHQQHWAHEVRGLVRTPLAIGEPVQTVREALLAFVGLIERGTRPPVGLEDGARAVAIAEACMRSAAAGQPVLVDPLDLG